MDKRVNCELCQRRMGERDKGLREASGNIAGPQMGHMMIFTRTGRTAACLNEAWQEEA